MNIFFIDQNPKIAAQMLCDDHIRKMQIESAQMLCTTFWHYNYTAPYKKCHYNHPSTIWVRQSIDYFNWLLDHGLEICEEFTKRYNKKHKTEEVLLWVQEYKNIIEPLFPEKGFKNPPQCMPDIYKNEDTITAYRDFYKYDKVGIKGLKWVRTTNIPYWL